MTASMVEGFVHHTGVHCGSTALTDVVRHRGIPWSEPMVFGLGSGLSYFYLALDHASPSRMFFGRSGRFEDSFVERTGLIHDARRTLDAELAARDVKAMIRAGDPVLIKSDIRFLPHYATSVEYNGHLVVVAGYDDDEDEIYVADTHFEGLCAISNEDLMATMSSAGAPIFFPDCMYGTLRRSETERPLAEAIPEAIQLTSHRMIEEDSDYLGQSALDRLPELLPSFAEREDAAWIAKFAYQVIEKRGTGGGFFRRLYARFLDEAKAHARIDPALAPAMHAVADRWTQLAAALKRASAEPQAWAATIPIATELAAAERAFHARAAR